MSTHNTLVLINMYREKEVAAVRTPAGIVFMGVKNLTKDELKTLQSIPQAQLDAALRWQE
ncbi:hypothetical protein [Enterobacter asburiae]|uniref:hypothetical protein n=1 Tax=Enterobacter asburiae TaxID=61645 RepID=UPI00192C1941|nr:hypothetical protein [Enterobacter asburiae]MBL5924977.1 hypothetical protein [Enterobacter asburiae]MBL5956392.1 hypothetical protein [Enterobacter asburiae]